MKLLTLFFLLLSISLFNHSYAQNDKNPRKEDFNGDGHADLIKAQYQGGSGFGGRVIYLTDGQTGEEYQLDTYGSFGSFLRVVPLPVELEKKGFGKIIMESLCQCTQKDQPEGLSGLVNECLYTKSEGQGRRFAQITGTPLL